MIGIIPTRAGSKRFPKKNLLKLGGKTLIERTISTAIESKVFTSIVFSSDDEQAIKIAQKFPIDIDRRPKELAGDNVRVVEVVKHVFALEKYKHEDTMGLMFVTTPFLEPKMLVRAAQLMEQEFDSVLTITKMPVPPQFALKKDGKKVLPWIDYTYFRSTTQKQKIEDLFYPNYLIQMCSKTVVHTYNGFIGDNCAYIDVEEKKSVDIDVPFDFEWAQWLLNKELSLK